MFIYYIYLLVITDWVYCIAKFDVYPFISACADDCLSCTTAGADKCDVCNQGFGLDSAAGTCGGKF